jgi:uncharacterized membrane protein YqjE
MSTSTTDIESMARSSARIAQRVLAIGENRFALLTVELQEEVERFLVSLVMAMGVAVCALLAAMAATAAIVVLAWPYAPVTALCLLAAGYLAAGAIIYRQLMHRLRAWRSFAATIEQIRKDRACLDTPIP